LIRAQSSNHVNQLCAGNQTKFVLSVHQAIPIFSNSSRKKSKRFSCICWKPEKTITYQLHQRIPHLMTQVLCSM